MIQIINNGELGHHPTLNHNENYNEPEEEFLSREHDAC